MAEQRCPMCGRPNSATAEICEHCGARLQPLLRESPDNKPIRPGEAPVEKDTREFEDTDFLRRLRNQQPIRPGDLPQPQETGELESTLPAWLRRLRGTDKEASEPPAVAADIDPPTNPLPLEEEAQAKADDTPDWLADLTAEPKDATGELPGWLEALGAAVTGGEAPLPTVDEPAAAGTPSEDVPDWLAGLTAESDPVAPAAQEPAAPSEDVPDWLAGLTADSEPAAPAAQEPAAPAEDVPDWLAGLTADSESAVPAAQEPAAPAEDMPDWLAGLTAESEPAAPAAQEPAAPVEDVPDWLAGLTAESEPAAPAAQEPAAPVEDVPDWLAGLTADSEPAAPVAEEPAAPAEDVPDWLAGLTAESEPAAPAAQELAASAEDVPDWLAGLTAESEPAAPAAQEPAAPVEDVPDWLAGLTAESEPAAPMAEEPATPAEDVPDWLAGLTAESEPAAPAAQEPATPAEDVPDWLAGLTAESEPAAPAAQEPATPAEDVPDWLAGLTAESEPAAPAAQEPAAPAEDMPDWLAGLTAESEPAAPAAQEPATPAEDVPDWLAGLTAESEPAVPAAQEPAAPAEDMPDWLAGLTAESEPAAPAAQEPATPAEDVPDWLTGLTAESEPAAPAAEEPAAPAEDVPDWLAGLSPAEGQAAADELETALTGMDEHSLDDAVAASLESESEMEGAASPALILEDEDEALEALEEALPDWLAALKPEGEAEPSAAAEESGSLAPAELPSWVQSMRPLEDVLEETLETDLATDTAEHEGPLAGLRGVLPFDARIPLTSKPELQGYKLEVTESQKQTVALLEKLLDDETQAVEPEAPEREGSLRFIRWGLSLALLLVIGLIHLAGEQTVLSMGMFPPDTLAFIDVVDQVDTARPALLVVDYDPAFVGEMEWALQPVVAHLQQRGITLLTFSTSPTGTALAQRVAPEALALGYLPGGPAGILGWTLAPTEIMPQDVDGNPVWDTLDVENLDDFGLLVVATHDATLARQWVEQTTAWQGMDDGRELPPLVMVISAQAEPLVRPYYDSGQVAGLVTGVTGGQAYMELTYQPITGNRWRAYSIGIMLAALLVMVGSGWSLIAGWRQRREQERMAEAEQ